MYKYLFIITILLLLSNHIPSTYSQCLENPLFGVKRMEACPEVDEQLLKSPKNLKESLVNGNSKMIQISFTCDNTKTPELCKKAQIAFDNAADIVSNTFDLKSPVVINGSFVDLCATFVRCPPGQKPPLGAAAPTRFMPLTDDDGAVRLYPQALVKQFQLPKHPEFSPLDISAGFNSKSDVFWFRGDPPIGKEQVDFEIVLVHEFLHGLGFVTSWDNYFNMNSLTPFPSFLLGDDVGKGSVSFTGFQEYPLDRFLVTTKDNSSLTLVTNKLNQFAPINTKFPNQDLFFGAFSKSLQFTETTQMFENGVTRDSIAFRLPDDDENVLMETGLVPYREGSSFTHLDFNAFADTPDFLMRFKAPRNVILDDIAKINGGDNTYTNPIGPKTIRMLQTIGYTVKENAATFKISQPDQPAAQSPAAPASAPAPQSTSKTATNNLNKSSEVNGAFTHTTNYSLLLSSFIISILLF